MERSQPRRAVGGSIGVRGNYTAIGERSVETFRKRHIDEALEMLDVQGGMFET
jgi:hypothetical protein